MTTVVSVTDARSRLGELVYRVANGEEVLIARRGKTLAALVPRVGHGEGSQSVESASQRAARLAAELGDRCRLSPKQQRRPEVLAKKGKAGGLCPAESNELDEPLAEYDRLALLRARAMNEMT